MGKPERKIEVISGEYLGHMGVLLRWTNWAHAKAKVRIDDGTVVVLKYYEFEQV